MIAGVMAGEEYFIPKVLTTSDGAKVACRLPDAKDGWYLSKGGRQAGKQASQHGKIAWVSKLAIKQEKIPAGVTFLYSSGKGRCCKVDREDSHCGPSVCKTHAHPICRRN